MQTYVCHKHFLKLAFASLRNRSKIHGKRILSSAATCRILNSNCLLTKIGRLKPISLAKIGEGLNHSYSKIHNGPWLYQVNIYDNLVSQKCGNSDKTQTTDNSLPGRHKFHKEIETALNEQICIEFNASFAYLAMANFYGRTEIALPGCQGFFMMMHQEEHEHAIVIINYILMRGGHPLVPSIASPDSKSSEWKDVTKALATAVQMECAVKEKLEAVTELAEKHKDYQLADFLSSSFLKEQNKSIWTLARLLTRSQMACIDKTGQFLFDKHLFDSFVSISKNNMMHLSDISQENSKNHK